MLIELDWLNMLVDGGENKCHFIQAAQVWFGNSIPGHDGRKKRVTFFFVLDQKGYDSEAFLNFPVSPKVSPSVVFEKS